MNRLAMVLLLGLAMALSSCEKADRKFDAAEWASTPHFERYVFAKDLIGGKLKGLTRDQVEALLGKPASNLPEGMSYTIQEGSGFEAVIFILVRFDEAGKCEEVLVSSD